MSISADLLLDLDVFIDTTEFAVAASLDGNQVSGIFDDSWEFATIGDAGISSTYPVLLCKASDVPADPYGDAVVIGAVQYRVVDMQPYGTGLTLLILEATA